MMLPARKKPRNQVNKNPENKVLLKASKNLPSLKLVSKNLTVFPKEIFNLTNLRILDLGNNNIEYIPIEIQNLKLLKVK